MDLPDIDIDVKDRNEALRELDYICASIMEKDGTSRPHNTGIYFQEIPHDPRTGLSTIDYKAAEKRGYFKIDLLNSSRPFFKKYV